MARNVHELRLWHRPRQGYTYVWGGDVAEGLPHGDDSVIEVIEVETGWQCLELQTRDLPPPQLGEMANLIGHWYRGPDGLPAYGGFENNKDLTPSYTLAELEYPSMHYTVIDTGEQVGKYTTKLGWNTNARSRRIAINKTRELLEDGSLVVRSKPLLAQMETFAASRTGKYQAVRNARDDLVMGYIICVMMLVEWLDMGEARRGQLQAVDMDGRPIVDGTMEEFGMEREDSRSMEERIIEKHLVTHARAEVQDHSTTGNLV